MTFISVWFVALFVLLLGVRRWAIPARFRAGAFAIGNIAFLCWTVGDVRQVWPILLFVALSYLALFIVRRGRWAFVGSIAVLTAIFLVFKRYPPVGSIIPLPGTIVTLGLSYILFRSIHVIVDYGDRVIERRPGVVAFFNYMLSFFTLLSGPIQRYEDYERSQYLAQADASRWEDVGDAIVRMTWGFMKVLVVSALFMRGQASCLSELAGAGQIAEQAFWLAGAALSFVGYLYSNFSGYMDVVIGLGRIAGFDLPENFNHPFSAANIQEFWKRWHITLSEWVRTYIFNPLLKWSAAKYQSRLAASVAGVVVVFVSFFIIGAWHGQTISAIIYGVALGAGAVVHRLYTSALRNAFGKSRAREISRTFWHSRLSQGLTFSHFALSVICLWPDFGVLMKMGPGTLALVLCVALCGLAVVAAVVFEVGGLLRTQGGRAARFFSWANSYWAKTVVTTAQLAVIAFVQVILALPAPGFVYQVH